MSYSSLPKRLEKWAEKRVPGLRTYLKRENLRDADKLIRDELAQRLDQVKGVVDGAKKKRVDRGKLKNLDLLDRATRKIEKVRDTIKFDSRGYRGIFDPEEVTEKDLMALLDFDEKLFNVVDELNDAAGKLAALDDQALGDAIYAFEDQVEFIFNLLQDRERYSSEVLPQAGAAPAKAE